MSKEIKDYLHLEKWGKVIGYGREYGISTKGRIKGYRRASFGASNRIKYENYLRPE